jgi:hypothetical protein
MTLDDDFHREMLRGVQRCKTEIGYHPQYWLQMVAEYGGVDAAKRLLQGDRASDGFTRLWEEGRLDLSVEFFVLMPRYEELFTSQERAEARRRLELHDFQVAGHFPPTSPSAVNESMLSEKISDAPAPVRDTPVVRPIIASGECNGIWPTTADLQAAHSAFGTREPRDIFYRAATDLVAMALDDRASVTTAEALGVLLQTWNKAYYQYHPADASHYDALDEVLGRHSAWLKSVRARTIDSFSEDDEDSVADVFTDFERVLGPVGAAKALHLLAPEFLPLWDRAIATAYGLELARVGANSRRYVDFLKIVKDQCEGLGGSNAVGRNVLKAIDEYNYCRFTKGWINPKSSA